MRGPRITLLSRAERYVWLVPPAVVVVAWLIAPSVTHIPSYKLPRLWSVITTIWQILKNGTLVDAVGSSLSRLAMGLVVGGVLGFALGLLLGTIRVVRLFAEPVLAFFQAVAGIAWIPMAIVWFGFGKGPVIFVVANTIFFIILYNTTLGVERIDPVLIAAVRTLGGSRWQVLRDVIIPGAMVNVLAGLRGGVAFGWRALVAVELIAANSGLGFITLQASRNYQGALVIAGILAIGTVWIIMDMLILRPLERRTVMRWGLVAPVRRRSRIRHLRQRASQWRQVVTTETGG
jgi:ABC-type nitrate/sulfonate/bicarbonate transport system permease component